jgi:hypothetical protein
MITLVAWHRTRLLLLAVAVTVAMLMARETLAKDLDLRLAAKPVDTAAPQPDPGDVLAKLLPPRTDSASDWYAPLEPLHRCGEPRLLPTCVPPPPCHPALPPRPYDLVGMPGAPTCGPIYRGPCAPRTGTHDNGPHPRIHRIHDRAFDWFYAPRTPIHP